MSEPASSSAAHLISELQCPHCDHRQCMTMPTTACLYFHECPSCGVVFKPKPGDCCVFCSYGDVPCPPVQAERSCGEPNGVEEVPNEAGSAEPLLALLNRELLSTDRARAAFDAVIRQGFEGKFCEPLSAAESNLLAQILKRYAAAGTAPLPAELASSSGQEIADVERMIAGLAASDFLVVDGSGRLIGAYPFTDRQTPHRVMFAGTASVVHAMCAIDALGAGAMLDQDIEISSSCASCRAPIMALTSDQGRTLGAISPPQMVVRVGSTGPCSCAADSLCPEIQFLCGSCEAADPANGAGGLIISAADALEVGRALFENRARLGD